MAATDSHHRFALALHKAVGAGGANSCFSPYSVASALTLLAEAARGATRDELISLLGELGPHAELLKAAVRLRQDAGREQPQLAVSNTLWVSDELPLEDSYKDELASWPGAAVASAPFAVDPEGARAEINADVDQTTRGLIPALLPPGSIQPDIVAVLVNALYLKAAWQQPFRKQNTAALDFHAPAGTRKVQTMRMDERMGYAHADGWQAVQLVAAGGLQTLVLLPDGDLAEAEAALDEHKLAGLLDAVRFSSVRLSLPKVSLDLRSELNDILRGLGVRTMFGRDADLTALSSDPRLAVSQVLHQAVLRVDEEGFEGAAATAVTMRAVSMITGEPVTVTVDRPFLLLVRHAESGAVYFFARVVEP